VIQSLAKWHKCDIDEFGKLDVRVGSYYALKWICGVGAVPLDRPMEPTKIIIGRPRRSPWMANKSISVVDPSEASRQLVSQVWVEKRNIVLLGDLSSPFSSIEICQQTVVANSSK
jgi:hypothetical protein